MRASELANKSVEELNAELLGLLREQFSLRVQYATGQLNQTHQIRMLVVILRVLRPFLTAR